MQTDPVFTERAGYDSYDPYSYVASNPVNFTDPSGASWLSQRAKGIGGPKFWKEAKKAATYAAGAALLYMMPYSALAAVAITGVIGAVAGATAVGAASYLYGGLKKSRTNQLDWNDQQARNYGKQGMETGARIGFAAGIAASLAVSFTAFQSLGASAALASWGSTLALWSTEFGIAFVFGSSGLVDDYLIFGGHNNIVKLSYKERNLSHQGKIGKILGEYDYNGDGQVDSLEYGIAWNTGARRSQVDTDHNGRVDFDEGLLYSFILHFNVKEADIGYMLDYNRN